MLSEAKLPKHFWGEVLLAAVHVINLSPAVALNTEVPDKIWFGKNVRYDHLHVFGCRAFIHVPKDERSKIKRQDNVSLLAMVRMNLAIGFMILLRTSLLEVVTYNSWKTRPLKTLIRWNRPHLRKIVISLMVIR